MKAIFIGSSSEAIGQAEGVAKALEEMEPSVRVDRWWDGVFPPSSLVLEAVEREARRVTGAILLATPDVMAESRGRLDPTPNSNVLIELAYFTAILGRPNVVLCLYQGASLPSDLEGYTSIEMGPFDPTKPISRAAAGVIGRWARTLPAIAEGFPSPIQVHGYSGLWDVVFRYAKFHGMDLSGKLAVRGKGTVLFHYDDRVRLGYAHMRTEIALGSCHYILADAIDVESIRIDGGDGSLAFSGSFFARQLVSSKGKLPNGIDLDLQTWAPNSYEARLEPDVAGGGIFRGAFRLAGGGDDVTAGEIVAEKRTASA
jgi:hypothetical protein